MPRYYFHLEGRNRASDVEGQDFPDVEAAHRHARLVAWDLARNAPQFSLQEAKIVLTDEDGRKVLSIALEGSTELHEN
jgi:hypothetical protein